MGFYSRIIFPILMDWTLRGAKISGYRKDLLKEVQGKVLEIGFGTGLNLPHYPPGVKHLSIVDPHPGMKRKAKKRLAKSPIQVEQHLLSAEKLPFQNQSFDSVVSTFTFCSIPDVELSLWEIHRVLRPKGRLFFLEHGLAPEAKVQKWQHRFTPWQKRLADGCHLNRDISQLIDGAGFKMLELKKFYHPGFPKVGGFFYQGVAEKLAS